jgi:hypothetical protein
MLTGWVSVIQKRTTKTTGKSVFAVDSVTLFG